MQPPPQLSLPARPGPFRRTPPAVFPPVMGLLGLGLAWRRGIGEFGLPPGLAEVFLGAATLLFLSAALALAVKIAARPGVVMEDLRVLPGRAGYAAASLCVLLVAAVLAPYAPAAARLVLHAGLGLHALLALLIVRVLLTGPAEQRRITPVWHLSFVGFVIAGLSAPALGQPLLALAVLLGTAPVAALVWAAGLGQIVKAGVPAPLRPLLAMHLAPACLLGLVAQGLGMDVLAGGFAVLAALILAALLVSARWLAAAGFSPLWGAFTFPAAACAALFLALGGAWRLPGGILLVAASFLVLLVAAKVLRLWAGGQLAAKTGAATA